MILVTIFSIIGTYLNIKKNKICFYIWAVTNSAWCVYDFSIGAWEQGIVFAVYTCLSVYGIFQWNKE